MRTEWIVREIVSRAATVAGLFALLASNGFAQQQPISSSWQLVPESSAYYLASMNHEAMWNAVVNSNAYKMLNETPAAEKMRRAYRRGLFRGWDQFGSHPLRYFLEGWAQSIDSVQGKMIRPILREAFKNEVFIYGDSEILELATAVSTAFREISPLISSDDGPPPNGETQRKIMSVIRKHAAGIQLPTVVVGSFVDNPEDFHGMVDLMVSGLEQALQNSPDDLDFFVDGYQRIKNEQSNLLTFTLKGAEIPWGSLFPEPDSKELGDMIAQICADKSLAIAVGVWQNTLLMTIGPSLEHVDHLGKGSLLIDHPKLAAVKAALGSGKQLTSVYYSSEAMGQAYDFEYAFDAIPQSIEQALAQTGEIELVRLQTKEFLDALTAELRGFARDISDTFSRQGAVVSFSYLAPEGVEGFAMNWRENKWLDDSAPLALVRHVGPHPMAFFIDRSSGGAEQYALIQKWYRRAFDFAETWAPKSMPEERVDRVTLILQKIRPLVERLDKILAELIIPQVDDKESALVVDLERARPSWFTAMPATDVAVPLPSIALLTQIGERTKIEAAGGELFELAEDVVKLIRELDPDALPTDFQLPRPEVSREGGETMYAFSLPEELGVNAALTPHIRLSDSRLAFGYMPEQTAELFAAHSPHLFGPAASEQKAMAINFFDNRRLIDGVKAWVDYAAAVGAQNGARLEWSGGGESDLLDMTEAEVRQSLDALWEFLKCFHGFSSRSYMASGAQTTHFLWKFEDRAASASKE